MVFTRTTCFFGTSSGIVDSMAGMWNAWPTLRSAPMISTSGTDTWPMAIIMPMINAMVPTKASAAMSTYLRLKRSATTPPSGASKPCGSMEHSEASASMSAESVVSVTNHTPA